MLSMKTLKVAIVTMGSALLLGSGFAAAQETTIRLDAMPTDDTEAALRYAQETLPAANAMGRHTVGLQNALDLVVKPRRAITLNEDVYLRVDLTNGAFSVNPMVVVGTITATVPAVDNTPAVPAEYDFDTTTAGVMLSSGGVGQDFVVFEIGAVTASPNTQLVGIRIDAAGSGTPQSPAADLRIASGASAITASITSYSNPDDALDEVNGTGAFAGSGAIVHVQSGLEVAFKPAKPVPTSSVAAGFRRFVTSGVSAAWASADGGQARIGWLITRANTSGLLMLRNAANGVIITGAQEILSATGQVQWEVNGELDFGAFHALLESFLDGEADPKITPTNAQAMCPTGAANATDRGTLRDAEGELLIDEDGTLPTGASSGSTGWKVPGAYLLCVNVDLLGLGEAGTGTNTVQIPETEFTAKAYTRTGTSAAPRMVGEGTVGSIKRDGATVQIAYLTTSEKHNQRLIIVNRGKAPISITDMKFQTEAGTDVELSALAMAAVGTDADMIPGGETRVIRMGGDLGMLNITGDSRRTAATLSFNGIAGNISVATTQVNLSDSSTDTVMWAVK